MDLTAPRSRRWFGVIGVSAGMMLLTMDAGIASVALPFITSDLGVTASSTVLLVVVYNLVLAMTLLPLASLGERIGLKRLFSVGVFLYILGAGLCLLVNQLELLILVRGLQAVGASAALSVAIALVRSLYSPAQLGMGLGINTVAAVTGASLAPVVGGFVIAAASWKWVFAAGVPLAVLCLALSRNIPEVERSGGKFDLPGAGLCAATFGLLVVGLESLNYDFNRLLSAALIVAGVVVAFTFVRHERREPKPVLPVDLLAQPALSLSVAGAFCAVLASWILILSIPFLLVEHGFTSAQIGTLILPYALSTAIFAPLSGFMSDHISPVLLGTLGLGIAVWGLFSFAFLDSDFTHFAIAWRMALCGTGFGLFFSPNARLIIGSVPADRSASASSMISTTRMFGQALGSTLYGGFLAFGFGSSESIAWLTAGLACTALVFSLARWWCRVPVGN